MAVVAMAVATVVAKATEAKRVAARAVGTQVVVASAAVMVVVAMAVASCGKRKRFPHTQDREVVAEGVVRVEWVVEAGGSQHARADHLARRRCMMCTVPSMTVRRNRQYARQG